jgi:4-aminobutyrate aminotransferase-like enzyme
MGDVHPHSLKAELVRTLSRVTFERWTAGAVGGAVKGRAILGNSGFEAVEAALKTAILATGRRGVVAFAGGYHGLGYGALNVTHRALFREPFLAQLGGFAVFVTFPTTEEQMSRMGERLEDRLRRGDMGAVLVEPVQGRGGIRVPPRGFLRILRELCDRHKVLLICDEIFTGFGRTGRWFGCEHDEVAPDIVCLGKALTNGFPLSACVGRDEVMVQAWPKSRGEAWHTSTYLGHPVGCAMALAQVAEIEKRGLVEKSAARGRELMALLGSLVSRTDKVTFVVRGRGLMVGVEFVGRDGKPAGEEVWAVVKGMLSGAFIVLPEGEHGEVLALNPPLTISRAQLASAVSALHDVVSEL